MTFEEALERELQSEDIPFDVAPISDFDKAHVGEILAGMGDWFSADLLRLCGHADRDNLERLRGAFPLHVQAYEAYLKGRDDE